MSNPYRLDLPASPDLDQQRKRAKDLLKALRAGDAEAADRFRHSHPRLSAHTPDVIRDRARLADAHWVIAREYGFASWVRFKAHVESLTGQKELRRPFETELQYYRDRAAGMLSVFATGERNALRLVRLFHPDFSRASEADIRAATLSQADAELILAREHGFETWDAFADYVAALRENRASEPFALAFEAIKANDRAKLNELLGLHRKLANAAGTNGNRLIMLAMSFNRPDMVEDLLAADADPNLSNNKGWTALHQAAYSQPEGDAASLLGTIDKLLAAGASPDAEAYGDGGTPLAIALFWGHVPLAERLAREAVTPHNLRIASGLGRLDLMAAFFDRGQLRPEAGYHREFHRPHSGFPPWRPSDDPAEILSEALTYAARSGRNDAMAFLLERGADLDAEPYNGTALHWAIARKRTDAARWLLDHGANINRQANFGGIRGVTPLHVAAAWGGNVEGARLLLDRGADTTIRDAEQNSPPAGWAEYFGNAEIARLIVEKP